MLVYRVFPYDRSARTGQPGHPMFQPQQGAGRADHPDLYTAGYFAGSPEAAVGEAFGDLARWRAAMFIKPSGGRRALAVIELPDDLSILDLDNGQELHERNIRPSRVVTRDRSVTKEWALRVFEETRDDGERRWDGVKWWSFWSPDWSIYTTFTPAGQKPAHRVLEVRPLDLTASEVIEASRVLNREIV